MSGRGGGKSSGRGSGGRGSGQAHQAPGGGGGGGTAAGRRCADGHTIATWCLPIAPTRTKRAGAPDRVAYRCRPHENGNPVKQAPAENGSVEAQPAAAAAAPKPSAGAHAGPYPRLQFAHYSSMSQQPHMCGTRRRWLGQGLVCERAVPARGTTSAARQQQRGCRHGGTKYNGQASRWRC